MPAQVTGELGHFRQKAPALEPNFSSSLMLGIFHSSRIATSTFFPSRVHSVMATCIKAEPMPLP